MLQLVRQKPINEQPLDWHFFIVAVELPEAHR